MHKLKLGLYECLASEIGKKKTLTITTLSTLNLSQEDATKVSVIF